MISASRSAGGGTRGRKCCTTPLGANVVTTMAAGTQMINTQRAAKNVVVSRG